MELLVNIISIAVALAIFNVWVLRPTKVSPWRGGDAKSLRDEFEVYGLPSWALPVVGVLKLGLAGLLVAGIWIPSLTLPAAIGIALMMGGAVLVHMRVRDAMLKSVPAFSLMLCALVVAVI